jgi:cystathionine beta-lyase/cystathionine gamma-synthase
MKNKIILDYINKVLENMPKNWLNLTTHRLDIYDEKLAKTQFLKQFEVLFNAKNSEALSLDELPTAYDYIRLGHPLSCIVEWVIAHLNNTNANNVISFSSKTASILAILRKNLFANKNTQIIYTGKLPDFFDAELLRRIYGYKFDLLKVENTSAISKFNGSTIFISQKEDIFNFDLRSTIDFSINIHALLGSILVVNGEHNESYIPEIQHVRRRETIAMTPANSLAALKFLIEPSSFDATKNKKETSKTLVLDSIKAITGTNTKALVGSSGLSIQYAILMGLIHDALENHKGKAIKIVVPPNCYGGTNDQARRVAACIKNVEILDLPVDGEHDMVESIDLVLNKIANENGIPFIIAEIPTNPRVEVPNLKKLRDVLTEVRKSITGDIAIDPIFILDQTFCPNVHFLGEGEILSTVRTISFASGSKFPSGGKCTAGYCIGNTKTNTLMEKIELHLTLCDNEATALQYKILAKQMPSLNQRIKDAYINTRKFVNFISDKLPEARINFVSEALAKKGFMPSVFSLDLPTKGNTDKERETYRRELNLRLINLMITKIPNESKYCVSYGQLNGCYWTIPATSTQGTTKEGDKDYIARVSLSPNMDLALHEKVFLNFVKDI